MADKSTLLETLAEPLRAYMDGTGPVPTSGALITYQCAYLSECKRNREADYLAYSKLLDDVVDKKSGRGAEA